VERDVPASCGLKHERRGGHTYCCCCCCCLMWRAVSDGWHTL
jgi:hypothetical protein